MNKLNTIVMCLGKFDILHTGHLYYLKEAAKYGKYLIVVITADKYLLEKPTFNQDIRKKTLEMLPFVNEVYICNSKTGIPAIQRYKPKLLIKGPDYENSCDKNFTIEKNEVEKYGGEVKIIKPDVIYSSTKLKYDKDIFIKLSNNFSLNLIKQFYNKTKKLTVGVIGEPIIDIFQPIKPMGQSFKSYCPSFLASQKVYFQRGGASYVYRHLKNFCKRVYHYPDPKDFIIKKLRFIDIYNNTKHFEIKYNNLLKKDNITTYNKKFNNIINTCNLTLIADFGHSFFDGRKITDNLYLMIQTNSSNFGYNKADKWNKYKSKLVCLDRNEASLILGKEIKNCNISIMKQIFNKLNTETIILTMHKYGSIYYDGNKYVTFPALAMSIVDSIGAGDAFFTIASLAHYLNYEPIQILYLASLAAAANTQHLCTKYSCKIQDMERINKLL